MRRKRAAEEEPENHDRWLVSYADFITLMFAFFTIMYATSTKDFNKEKQFEESVKKAFFALVKFGGQDGPGEFPEIAEDASPIAPPIEVFKKKNAGPTELLDAIERAAQDKLTKEEREQLNLKFKEDALGVRVSLDSSAVFDSGSAAIRKDILKSLDKLASLLREVNRSMLVEGHTDNQPIKTPNYPSNWELAGARASTIVRYMIKAHEMSPSKLAAISYADQRPISSNATEVGRSKNRRIEILLTTR